MTEGPAGEQTALPDVAAARITEGTETPKDGTVVLTLPPRSFTAVEASIAPSQ